MINKVSNIEAEGEELIIENEFGDVVIVPKEKADWVRDKINQGCYDCVDSLVSTLPTMNDYNK
jgi:hypothetical protein